MYRFEVPGRIPTLNWYRNAHFYKLNKSKKEWEEKIKNAIIEAKITKINTPITLNLTTFTSRKRDVDGTIVGVKYIQDTLVRMGLIEDDSPEYIQCVILQWSRSKDEKLICIIQ